MEKRSNLRKRSEFLTGAMPAKIDLDILHDAVDIVIFKGLHIVHDIMQDESAEPELKLKAMSSAISAGKYATERKIKTTDATPELEIGASYILDTESDDVEEG